MKKDLQSTALGNVAGGKIVESKDGKWVVVPSFCEEFSTEEEAKKFVESLKFGYNGGKNPLFDYKTDKKINKK